MSMCNGFDAYLQEYREGKRLPPDVEGRACRLSDRKEYDVRTKS